MWIYLQSAVETWDVRLDFDVNHDLLTSFSDDILCHFHVRYSDFGGTYCCKIKYIVDIWELFSVVPSLHRWGVGGLLQWVEPMDRVDVLPVSTGDRVGRALNCKKTGTISRCTRPHDWTKPTWGQPCRSKTRVEKSCIEPLLFIDS